ncbi:hypothetical protein AB0J72_22245 [Dactylosporangium sp. NPDC049742]|uniref:hypothetical protein n=1 Tax=Dactylosporangium sp. NPDC049742 TaxID=3154737 RepID=UPI00343A03F6
MNRPAVLRGLAANPALDPVLLAPLLTAGDLAVLDALAARPDLTAAMARALARHPDLDVRLALARNPVAAPHVWRLFAEDPDEAVRVALAQGHSADHRPAVDLPLPGDAQLALAADAAVPVRLALARRRDLSEPARLWLATDPSAQVREALARSWPAPPEPVLRQLLTDPDPAVRRAAVSDAVPPDLVAGLLADPATREDAARHTLLPPATDPAACGTAAGDAGPARGVGVDVAGLVGDADPAVREAVAGNPRVPLAAVLPLADDPDEDVRVAVMLRSDLPDADRSRIAAGVEPQTYHVAGWLLPSHASPAVRAAHARSPFVWCRRAVAFSSDLPAEAVAVLAADEDHSVRLLLAEHHPDVPGHILPDLVCSTGHARWALARHPAMPAGALAAMALGDDADLRRVAATAPNLPPAVAEALAGHADDTTRAYVAANPALPVPAVIALLDDPDPRVAEAAARNPRLPAATAGRLLAAGAPR